MRMRSDLLLPMTFVALAACTKAVGDPGFGTTDPGSSEDSGSTPEAGDDVVGSSDASPEDASMPVMSPRDSGSGRAETGGGDAQPSSGDAETDAPSGGDQETGRLVGITAAHNVVRAMVSTQPALPDLTWSPMLAAYAQEWATQLASDPSTCAQPVHRSGSDLQAKNYGENLAAFSGRGGVGNVSTAQQAVNGWASEVSCWTYGTILGSEQCNMTCTTNLHSDGCGHYTQIVWRKSLLLGCGVATCMNGQSTEDIWICNYSPAGNFVGQAPY
jgi:pathogenesis-related protein 1